jgi:hypothetical protein
MAQGDGRTLEEAFDDYARNKASAFIEEQGVNEMGFTDAMQLFEDTFHPVEILVKLRPHNQWVKGYKVKDPGS